MSRFVVRKNTLPYVHQWAVIDTGTGDKVGEYRTNQLADTARCRFETYGIPDDTHGTPPKFENAWNTVSKRMKHPDGDKLPEAPKIKHQHSDRRRVELD